MGDFAFPCFRLAAEYKNAPKMIAMDIQAKLNKIEGVVKIDVVSGYLNFFVDNKLPSFLFLINC